MLGGIGIVPDDETTMSSSSSSSAYHTPVFIGLVCVMCFALVLLLHHCVLVACRNRRRRSPPQQQAEEDSSSSSSSSRAHLVKNSAGGGGELGVVCPYREGESWSETTCPVCLADFADGEPVRVLPECMHYFHAQCIDTWLRGSTSCPMCRAETTPTPSSADLQHHHFSGVSLEEILVRT